MKEKELYFYESASARMLEFDQIIRKLEEHACTQKAKEKIRRLSPGLVETEVKAQLRDTTQAKEMIEKCGIPPLTALEGIEELVDAAQKGGCLTPEELTRAEMYLTAVKRMKDYLYRGIQFGIGLAYYEENLDSLDEIRKEFGEKIRNGKVDDYASKLLRSLREGISRKEAEMREKADSVMRSHKECMSDSFSTIRSGRVCVPVKKEYKFKISGAVIDKSATGNTFFIEPAAAAKIYEELQELKIDEENEERRILYTLSAMLSDKAELVRANNKTMEKLDFFFAKGKLSLELEGTLPEIVSERFISLREGRHPLMNKEINVPLDFEIGGDVQGVIITGPNTGGKTVAIKTVALNCLMAQCGLHVTCKEARICLSNQILCDIGDGQNLAENLSTFSAHITNVLEILRNADEESLVIMDELGSGTDPAEGMGIAVSILQELKKCGALYLVTTHYPEVKNYGEREEGVINARMTFDRESLKPLYHLVIGEAGESCALYIARKLGMPEEMLRRAAQAAYGKPPQVDNQAKESGMNGELAGDLFWNYERNEQELKKEKSPHIRRQKAAAGGNKLAEKFQIGDSVMIYPDQKIGIVCEPVNEKGVLRIQLPEKKIYINHKRVKLQVKADRLYPEGYDFSIVFDTVENRKIRHQMERKYVENQMIRYKE